MQTHRKAIGLVLVLIVSLSCQFLTVQEMPAPVTVTELPRQTEPPAVTATAVTDTPSVPTETPIPAGLNPTGPYVMYKSPEDIWISNPDGSFPTQLASQGLNLKRVNLRRALSPQGDRLALVANHAEGFNLVEVRIPSGEQKTLTRLHSITEEEILKDGESEKALTAYALREYDNVTWQPGEGRYLAFVGALDGPTTDLYLYDMQSGEITQLTDGPTQIVLPSWSPDGRYILYYETTWEPPLVNGWQHYKHLEGVFAIRVADRAIIPLPRSHEWYFVDWQDENHYLIYDDGPNCTYQNLRSIDVATGEATLVTDILFSHVARSPENGALLISENTNCEDVVPGEGIFLLLPGQTIPTRLLDKKDYAQPDWLPESRVFYIYPYGLISSDGMTRYDPPPGSAYDPALSRKGYQAWYVIENFQGRVEVKVPGSDWQKIFDGHIETTVWDPLSGETLLFTDRDGMLYAASYPDFTPREMGQTHHNIMQIIWVQ